MSDASRTGFRLLWAAQTISVFGTRVSSVGMPLLAASALNGTPRELGFLVAIAYAPFLLVGLPAGVWVDRLPRCPILVWMDIARAVLLASIPLAAWTGRLTFAQVYVVGFLAGVCTVFFDVAYQSFLPAVVSRAQLVQRNSQLESTRSLADVTGPGIAGGLVQFTSAAGAVLVDALSFVASAGLIVAIRQHEPPPAAGARRSMRAEIGEGLRHIAHHPLLRPIALCTATSNFAGNMSFAISVLYLTRSLGLSPLQYGLLNSAIGVGVFVAATVGRRLVSRLGTGRALIVGITLAAPALLATPLLPVLDPWLLLAVLGPLWLVGGFGGALYNINQVSLRQQITPDRLLGRVNATMRFAVWGVIPVGALTGGALAGAIGVRATLLLSGALSLLPALWLLASPVRRLQAAPLPSER